MRKYILLIGTAILLFALSSGGVWYYQKYMGKGIDATDLAEGKSKSPYGKTPTFRSTETDPGADSDLNKTKAEAERRDSIRKQEAATVARKQTLDLILKDIAFEQSEMQKLQKQLLDEKITVEKLLREINDRKEAITRSRKDADNERREFNASVQAYGAVDIIRVKQLAEIFNKMEPASAAKFFQEMDKSGNLETAAKVFTTMEPRNAAKVMDEFAKSKQETSTRLLTKFKSIMPPPKEKDTGL